MHTFESTDKRRTKSNEIMEFRILSFFVSFFGFASFLSLILVIEKLRSLLQKSDRSIVVNKKCIQGLCIKFRNLSTSTVNRVFFKIKWLNNLNFTANAVNIISVSVVKNYRWLQ